MNHLLSFRENLFGDEGQIRGIFSRDNLEPIPAVIFQRLRMQFKALMHRFRKVTEPIVLEGGVKFNPISSPPKELELVQEFESQIHVLCRMFRLQHNKIFLMSGWK